MTAPAPLWRSALTGLCERQERPPDDARRTVLLRSRCAAVAILVTMNLVGCAGVKPASAPPVIVGAVMCPEPATPALPRLDGATSFDAPAAWATLMERDDTLRAYIAALRRTVACYAAQTPQTINPSD